MSVAQHQTDHDRPLPFPPDLHQGVQGAAPQKPALYADKLKTNVTWDNRLRRNVLEITLDKEEDSFVDLGQEPVHRLFRTLGINTEKDVEGFFQRSKSIHVWLVNGINLDRFCKNESIRVTKSIKTGFIRPAGKKEVTVTVTGLDFNTPDTFVMSYLGKFGSVVTTSVIYERYKEGPFRGKYNGERKYQVDFTKSSGVMGTFHVIDGSRVRIYYPGNKKTCGRCHQTADNCKGEAVAKNCEENGGTRVDLLDHMKNLWKNVGFQPKDFHLNTEDDTNDATIKDKLKFSPKIAVPTPSEEDKSKYDGISLKNFPKETKKSEIIEFLLSKGLPEDFTKDNIEVGTHGNVEIRMISAETCQQMISQIHFAETRQTFFGKPIYCRAIRELTPVKNAQEASNDASTSQTNEKATTDSDKEVKKPKKKKKVGTKKDVGGWEDILTTEDGEFDDAGDEKFDDFEFGPQIENLANSKLFKNVEETSGEDTDIEPSNPALKFLRDPKTPATTKPPKRGRPTPTGTSATKIEKKTKTQ